MDNFFIITNIEKDPDYSITKEIQQFFLDHGKKCEIEVEESRKEAEGYHYTDPETIPKDTQCILALGGDGTLIQAARDVAQMGIPLLGVNLGNLGYLCELNTYNMVPAFMRLLEDEYSIEKRMMLKGKLYRKEKVVEQDIALNDIVIHRIGSLHIMNFVIYVNGEHLNTYNSDGIIVSTPTGSTGYSMSAGGPIVEPSAELIVITPINPHALNRKSIILSPEDEIMIELGTRKGGLKEEAGIAFDGERSIPFYQGNRIVISRSKKRTKILKINKIGFLATLRKKMQECN